MHTDPIADMLTRIRNASRARHRNVDIPSSRMKKEIARVLLSHRFIRRAVEVEDNKQNILRIFPRYDRDAFPSPACNAMPPCAS
jgi:small subunit ribosomal protein S8